MVSTQVPDTQWTVDVFGSKVPSASSNVHCGIDKRSVQYEAIDIHGLSLMLWSPASFYMLVFQFSILPQVSIVEVQWSGICCLPWLVCYAKLWLGSFLQNSFLAVNWKLLRSP